MYNICLTIRVLFQTNTSFFKFIGVSVVDRLVRPCLLNLEYWISSAEILEAGWVRWHAVLLFIGMKPELILIVETKNNQIMVWAAVAVSVGPSFEQSRPVVWK